MWIPVVEVERPGKRLQQATEPRKMAIYAAQDAKWSQSCVHVVPNYLNAVPKLYQSRVHVVPNYLKAVPKLYQSRVQVVPNHLKAVPKLTEPEDIPASQVVDDFHERLLPVRGDVVEGLAAFIKVLHLIKKMRMVMMMMAAIMGMMKKMMRMVMMMS